MCRREFDSRYPHKNKELNAKRSAIIFLADRENRTEAARSRPELCKGRAAERGSGSSDIFGAERTKISSEADRFSLPA